MSTLLILIATFIPQLQFAAVRHAAESPVRGGWGPTLRFDTDNLASVYTIRGGPRPEAVPNHHWVRESIHAYDAGPDYAWQLYRLEGAGQLRHTAETFPAGTWVPKELDTPERRARRARQSGRTNYEIYEPANDFASK